MAEKQKELEDTMKKLNNTLFVSSTKQSDLTKGNYNLVKSNNYLYKDYLESMKEVNNLRLQLKSRDATIKILADTLRKVTSIKKNNSL
jgi:hypothetical protein